jgi:hypothetical protein
LVQRLLLSESPPLPMAVKLPFLSSILFSSPSLHFCISFF